MATRKLRSGDFCHEQHDLIMRMGGYLEELLNTDATDTDRVNFLKAVTSTLVLEFQYYNEHYQGWLDDRRSGRRLAVLEENERRLIELVNKYYGETGA